MTDPHDRLERAFQLHQSGQVRDALALYDQLLPQQQNNARLLYLAGTAHLQLGQTEQGIALLRTSLAVNPDNAAAHNNVGRALQGLRRMEEALDSYDSALSLKPDYAEAHYNRGVALQALGRPKEALAAYDKALALDPDFAAVYADRGLVLHDLKRLDEAVVSYDSALAINPGRAETHNNRGVALQELMRLDEALASFDRAIAAKPDYAKAYCNKSYVLLLKGDFDPGWELLEWRFARVKPQFPDAHWLGAQSLERKTILLHAEEGLGDTIQFCRYAKSVQRLGARVLLEVQKPLVNLLQGLEGVAGIVERGKPRPPFDYHCPLLSLPLALQNAGAGIPDSKPYLQADAAKTRYWKDRIAKFSKLKVGLVWSCGLRPEKPEWRALNERRNIPLEVFCQGLNGVDAAFFSLQKGAQPEAELALHQQALWPGDNFKNFMGEVADFSDTAAIIANLDMVISVDTSTAHLAGAMGKPVWLLSKFDPDWRWLVGRDDSIWYPSMTIYRQNDDKSWQPLLQRVADDLAKITPTNSR